MDTLSSFNSLKIKMVLFLMAVSLTLGGTAFAQVTPAGGFTPPDDTPSVKVGGVFYGNYTYTSKPKITDADGNSVSANSFDVARSYLNFTGNISHIVSFRLTPDITRAANVGNSLVFRVKYGFVQFGLDDWSGKWKQTWVRIGANQTPFVDWEEGVYRYRFQGTVFSERVGRLTSSDFGTSFHTNFPDNYGEIHVGVYNGEGYATSEVNSRKAVQTRITIRPLPKGALTPRGLRLTAFYDKDSYVRNDAKNRLVLMALFEHPHVVAGFDYLDAQDKQTAVSPWLHGKGYSIWATPILKQKGAGPELLLRWDSYEPNHNAVSATGGKQKQNMWIVGPAYWFPHQGTVAATLLADVENVTFPGTATPAQRRYAVHANFTF